MRIIADSGATKTEWTFVQNGLEDSSLFTQGINPYFQDADAIKKILEEELKPQLTGQSADKLSFYGAGISTNKNHDMVKDCLQAFFSCEVEVFHDLLGAARSLCGHRAGIACILGTGSNSCYYDGKEIRRNIQSGGYVISDEGSGAHMGKLLLRDFMYDRLPATIKRHILFSEQEILETLYHKPTPNRYLASFAKILSEVMEEEYARNLVYGCFEEFIELRILPYPECKQVPVHFIGSIAESFENILKKVLADKSLTCGLILKRPMSGLISFHAHENH